MLYEVNHWWGDQLLILVMLQRLWPIGGQHHLPSWGRQFHHLVWFHHKERRDCMEYLHSRCLRQHHSKNQWMHRWLVVLVSSIRPIVRHKFDWGQGPAQALNSNISQAVKSSHDGTILKDSFANCTVSSRNIKRGLYCIAYTPTQCIEAIFWDEI